MAVGEDLLDGGAREVAALGAAVALARLHVVGVEEERVALVVERVALGVRGASTKVSQNHVVWARCHFVGDTSAIDWTT